MLRQYLMLFRTLWLGIIWSCAYIVRPVLEQKGYFPHHGIDVVHASVGIGAVCGALMLLMVLVQKAFNWRQLPQQLILIMLLMSLMYFALMPWWKLQMMLLHALAVLGLIWILLAPGKVIFTNHEARNEQGSRNEQG